MSPSRRRPGQTLPPGEAELDLVDALAQLSFAVQGALTRCAAAQDLSIVQARLLGILRDRSPTITELARFLRLDKSSVTGLVDRAQQRCLVKRIASTLDRRSVQVSLTDEGRDLSDRVSTDFAAEIAALVAGLSPAQRSRLTRAGSLIALADIRRSGAAREDDRFDMHKNALDGERQ